MGILPAVLADIFSGFEDRSDPFSEPEVANKVDDVHNQRGEYDNVRMKIRAESAAFSFDASRHGSKSRWGTHFGPIQVFKKGEGDEEIPSLKDVTSDTLDYWEARSSEARHPVLKARYADLVWDFAPKVRGRSANIVCAHTAIESYVKAVVDGKHLDEIDGHNKLARALSIGLATSDQNRVAHVVAALLDLEGTITQLGKLGTWGFSYDLLLKNKKVLLTDEQRSKIVDRLEQLLSDAAKIPEGSNTSRDHWAAKRAALRLAEYYRRSKKHEDVVRVLNTYATAVQSWAGNPLPMIVNSWLREVYDTMIRFKLKEQADAIAVLMRELGEGTIDTMGYITHKAKFTEREIEGFLDEMLQGNDDEIVARITERFTPDPRQVERLVEDLDREAPLSSVFTHCQLDSNGREVARVGSVEDDMEGNVVRMTGDIMRLESGFLSLVLLEWIKRSRVTADQILDRLMASPLFTKDRRQTLLRGITAYLEGDHIVSVHLLVPQVEHAFRTLLVLNDRSIYTEGQDDGLNVKTLWKLIDDSSCEREFGTNVATYFKILLADHRGWNLRNIVCHGLEALPANNPTLSDRLIHVLLLQSLVREEETS
jgi:Domain of unknown function (DUF4209)